MASRVREGPCWGEAFAAVDDVVLRLVQRYTWTTFHRDHLWHRRFSPIGATSASFRVPQCHVHYADASALSRTPVSTSFVSRSDSTGGPTPRDPNFPRVIRTLWYGIVIDFLNAKLPLSRTRWMPRWFSRNSAVRWFLRLDLELDYRILQKVATSNFPSNRLRY